MHRAFSSLAVGLLLVATTIVSAGPAATETPPAVALLTSVSAQDMGTFDRVTFTSEKGTPTILSAVYEVGPAFFSPGGQPVVPPIPGVRLVITMSNAADEDLTTNPVVVTYPGPFRSPRTFPTSPSSRSSRTSRRP